jgi:hypothetical protein
LQHVNLCAGSQRSQAVRDKQAKEELSGEEEEEEEDDELEGEEDDGLEGEGASDGDEEEDEEDTEEEEDDLLAFNSGRAHVGEASSSEESAEDEELQPMKLHAKKGAAKLSSAGQRRLQASTPEHSKESRAQLQVRTQACLLV